MRRNLTLIISEVIAIIFATLFFANICNAGTVTVPTTWITGDSVTATKLNNINSAFANVINGGLDNDNADTTNGYFFFKRVAALPSAGTQGAVYFLTSDNTLNLDTGAAFVTAATISGSHAQGDVVYYNGSSFTGLAAGTSGYVLKTQGAGANPAWQTVSNTTGASIIPITDASGYLPANSVNTLALKTTTGEVSTASANSSLTLPGGEYGFFPQLKGSAGSVETQVALRGASGTTNPVTTSYVTYLSLGSIAGGATIYAQQRYVTSSGEDFWLMLLVDKVTKEIVSAYASPDHPAYGNGGDFDKVPHPFGDFDKEKYEVVLADNSSVAEIRAQQTKEDSVLWIVNNKYKVLDGDLPYIPLHSGKFIDSNGTPVKEMVKILSSDIHVRKLWKMTSAEITEKENKRKKESDNHDADKNKEESDKNSAIGKLKSLGLTNAEIKSLIK